MISHQRSRYVSDLYYLSQFHTLLDLISLELMCHPYKCREVAQNQTEGSLAIMTKHNQVGIGPTVGGTNDHRINGGVQQGPAPQIVKKVIRSLRSILENPTSLNAKTSLTLLIMLWPLISIVIALLLQRIQPPITQFQVHLLLKSNL